MVRTARIVLNDFMNIACTISQIVAVCAGLIAITAAAVLICDSATGHAALGVSNFFSVMSLYGMGLSPFTRGILSAMSWVVLSGLIVYIPFTGIQMYCLSVANRARVLGFKPPPRKRTGRLSPLSNGSGTIEKKAANS